MSEEDPQRYLVKPEDRQPNESDSEEMIDRPLQNPGHRNFVPSEVKAQKHILSDSQPKVVDRPSQTVVQGVVRVDDSEFDNLMHEIAESHFQKYRLRMSLQQERKRYNKLVLRLYNYKGKHFVRRVPCRGSQE